MVARHECDCGVHCPDTAGPYDGPSWQPQSTAFREWPGPLAGVTLRVNHQGQPDSGRRQRCSGEARPAVPLGFCLLPSSLARPTHTVLAQHLISCRRAQRQWAPRPEMFNRQPLGMFKNFLCLLILKRITRARAPRTNLYKFSTCPRLGRASIWNSHTRRVGSPWADGETSTPILQWFRGLLS